MLALLCVSLHMLGAIAIGVVSCAGIPAQTQWTFDGPSSTLSASDGSGCLALVNCSAEQFGDVLIEPCGNNRCPGNAAQQWVLSPTGYFSTQLDKSLCLTLAGVSGPGVNLWPCSQGEQGDTQWTWAPPQLMSEYAADGALCLAHASNAPIVLNGSVVGRPWLGVGGLAAIGGARLLYNYPEPQRSEILDLMFLPGAGGALFQILKVEIEGDADSSYGSGSSFMHNSDPADASAARGIYLPWLIGQARARQPDIPLYALSWGAPSWVDGGTGQGLLSPTAVDYHVAYLKLAQETYGYEFEYTGVWNERSWSLGYTKALRAALDAANMSSTRIVVSDGSNSGCVDCPASWGDSSITTALANDPTFRAAVGVIGLHSGDVDGLSPLPGAWESYGLDYMQSESNVVDGALPQWDPNAGNEYGAGLSWPRVMLINYIRSRATAVILCPLMHAWTWQYGRNNHGLGQLTQPWSGHYAMVSSEGNRVRAGIVFLCNAPLHIRLFQGSAFWSQAHVSTLVPRGWRFLDDGGSGEVCPGGADTPCFVYAAFVPPDGAPGSMTLVIVNTDTESLAANFTLTGGGLPALCGTSLYSWVTSVDAYFVPGEPVVVSPSCELTVSLPGRAAASFASQNVSTAPRPPVPPKAPFAIPYVQSFDGLPLQSPGGLLSDLWGSFEVAADPAGGPGRALWQASGAPPISWLGRDGEPFTSLPTGLNAANANVSARVYVDLPPSGGPYCNATARVCARVPIWQPAEWNGATLGVCIEISLSQLLNRGGAWRLVDTSRIAGSSVVLASGILQAGWAGSWHSLAVVTLDDTVAAYIDGNLVASRSGLLGSAGVPGIGCDFNNVTFFDDVGVAAATPGSTRTPGSWLHDILPADRRLNNITGWAGMALNTSAPGVIAPLLISALGRFKSVNNSGSHLLDVLNATSGTSVLPSGAVTVSMAGCVADFLGFCYAPALPMPVSLPPSSGVYYVVSSEVAGSDLTTEMYGASVATTHVVRDGYTTMTYAGPDSPGLVAGRVVNVGPGGWQLTAEWDTAFGPLNLALVG